MHLSNRFLNSLSREQSLRDIVTLGGGLMAYVICGLSFHKFNATAAHYMQTLRFSSTLIIHAARYIATVELE